MLEELKIFDSLTDQELNELSIFCQKKVISRSETIFSAWDESNSLYIVESGKIQIVSTSDKVLAVLWSGDMFWEMTILWWENSRTATAIALEDSVLITILWVSMQRLAEKNNEIFEKIQKIIIERRQENIDI